MLSKEQIKTGVKKLQDYIAEHGDQISEEQAYRELYPDEIGRGGFTQIFQHVVHEGNLTASKASDDKPEEKTETAKAK